MIWFGIVIGALLALAGAAALFGSLLPREHSATLSARYPLAAAVIWPILADPKLSPVASAVELLPDAGGMPQWKEKQADGSWLTLERTMFEPPVRLQRRIVNTDLPYGGTWTMELAPDGEAASRLRITEDGFVTNPVFRFLALYVFGHTHTMRNYLTELGKKLGVEPVLEK